MLISEPSICFSCFWVEIRTFYFTMVVFWRKLGMLLKERKIK